MTVKSFPAQTLVERRHLARRFPIGKPSSLVPLRFAWSESVSVRKLFTVILIELVLTVLFYDISSPNNAKTLPSESSAFLISMVCMVLSVDV